MTEPFDVAAGLRLSDGRRIAEGFASDRWIADDVLGPIFAKDSAGLPRHRLCYVELPRGHFKTGAGAAVALAEVLADDDTDVIAIAADKDQSKIVLDAVDGYLTREPSLRGAFDVTADEFRRRGSRSRIRVLSSDAASAYGLGGTRRRFRVIADELTMWADEDLWSAIVSATGKVADVQLIILSNAGFDRDQSWQWRVRTAAQQRGHLFSSPGVIASWITPQWIAEMRALLPPPAFDRLIENIWPSSAGDFITEDQWRRCVDRSASPQTSGRGSFFGGLDLGLTKDRTAFATVHREGELVRLDDLMVWQGTSDEPVSIADVEETILGAHDRFKWLRVLADPWELRGSIERLEHKGVSIKQFRFTSAGVAQISKALYSHIATARLRVFPDPELEAEILGLRTVVQTGGGWRIDHKRGGFSDRAMALGLALVGASDEGITYPARTNINSIARNSIDGPRLPRVAGRDPPRLQLNRGKGDRPRTKTASSRCATGFHGQNHPDRLTHFVFGNHESARSTDTLYSLMSRRGDSKEPGSQCKELHSKRDGGNKERREQKTDYCKSHNLSRARSSLNSSCEETNAFDLSLHRVGRILRLIGKGNFFSSSFLVLGHLQFP